MNEKISVIIPLYNKEHEIKRTLDSVLSQSYQHFEIIVVDDHSNDGGPSIVRNIKDPRITLIEQEHRGVSFTRNHGVDLATGEYIAFLDADDEWMPKHLETILRLIEKHPEAGMFTTAYVIRTKEGQTRWPYYNSIPSFPWEGLLPDYFKSGALGQYPVNASTAVIPKKTFKEVGGFPERYWYGEDADLFGKIALKYPVAFSWESGAIYHFDVMNRACDRRLPIENEEPFIITARAALSKGEVPQKFTESLTEYIARKEIFRAKCNVRCGNAKIAQTILKQCNTRFFYKEKIKWLILAKIPYPIFLFLKNSQQKVIKMVRKDTFSAEKT